MLRFLSGGSVQDALIQQSKGKMSTRISVVVDSINSVKALDGRFQINQHQCKRLSDFYKRVGQFFNQLKEYFDDADYQWFHSLPSLDVIITVLQTGQLLVEKYTEENWFDSLMAGVNQDSFVAIHAELGDCIRSIHDAVVKQGFASRMQVPLMQLGTVAPLLFLDEDDKDVLFKRDAEEDKKWMLEKIKSRKIRTNSARDSTLAMEQKVSEIRSLDMASGKISEANDPKLGTETEELPNWLSIEPKEIEFLELLGSGGSAQVHKCRWLDRYFAVKVFGAGDVGNLRREVQNLLHLRHPNIVLLLGFSIRDTNERNIPMVVMELLDCDLHTLILKEGDIPINRAVDFIYQIATGMAYLHRKGLFHGDLKALNVLVKRHDGRNSSNRYELKISDFGVSVTMERPDDYDGHLSDYNSLNTYNVGTTRWRAPEVFNITSGCDETLYSMKADVYSFAMICVEVLTGDVPYHNISTGHIRKHVQSGHRPELPSKVPADLRKLIVECWSGDPSSRPSFSDICTKMQGLKYTQGKELSTFPCCLPSWFTD
jgi:hypothetical protein